MHIGALRKRVVLKRQTPTVDAEGAPAEAWTTVDRIWAKVEPLTGVEVLQAAQEEVRVSHQVSIRYRPDLDPAQVGISALHNMRLELGARVLDVQNALNVEERNAELQLLCLERQR